jgi:hypothetical protein
MEFFISFRNTSARCKSISYGLPRIDINCNLIPCLVQKLSSFTLQTQKSKISIHSSFNESGLSAGIVSPVAIARPSRISAPKT